MISRLPLTGDVSAGKLRQRHESNDTDCTHTVEHQLAFTHLQSFDILRKAECENASQNELLAFTRLETPDHGYGLQILLVGIVDELHKSNMVRTTTKRMKSRIVFIAPLSMKNK